MDHQWPLWSFRSVVIVELCKALSSDSYQLKSNLIQVGGGLLFSAILSPFPVFSGVWPLSGCFVNKLLLVTDVVLLQDVICSAKALSELQSFMLPSCNRDGMWLAYPFSCLSKVTLLALLSFLTSHLRGLFFIFDCHCWQLHISSGKENAIVIGLCWCRFLAARPCPIWRYRGGESWSLMLWKEDVPFHRIHWSHKREQRIPCKIDSASF